MHIRVRCTSGNGAHFTQDAFKFRQNAYSKRIHIHSKYCIFYLNTYTSLQNQGPATPAPSSSKLGPSLLCPRLSFAYTWQPLPQCRRFQALSGRLHTSPSESARALLVVLEFVSFYYCKQLECKLRHAVTLLLLPSGLVRLEGAGARGPE